MLNKNAGQIKTRIVNAAKSLYKTDDHESTYVVDLGMTEKNRWAVVLAFMDYDDSDEWEVYGKVAFQPKNSAMQEYDIDWQMPYDDVAGEVYDTEVSFDSGNVNSSADYLVKSWLQIVDTVEGEEDVKESVSLYNKKVPYLTEEKFSHIVLDYMLSEGCSFMEAVALTEDTITPEMLDNLEQMPSYRKLLNDIDYYFKAVDGIEGYRDGDFRDSPVNALQKEADFCKDTANFLGSLRFKGFDKNKMQQLSSETAKSMDYLDSSALRLTNILKKQDDSMYLQKDGSVNKKTNQKPGEYARRALRGIRDLFKRLGQEWIYDPDFDYKSLPPIDYKMYVLDSKDWKQGLVNVANIAIKEGAIDKYHLTAIGKYLNLNNAQLQYLTDYVMYMTD